MFRALLSLSIVFFVFLRAAGPAHAQDAPAKLAAGEAVTRELKGGDVHSFQLDTSAGQFLQLVVNQIGIDVVVLLYGPDGAKLAEVDSPNGTTGPEPVFVIAKAGGEHRVEVRSLEKTAPAGRYEVRLVELRAATPLDEKRIAAERLFAEATMFYSQGTAEGFRQAVAKYTESLPLFREVGEQGRLAAALQAVGFIHFERGETERAADFYQQTLDIRRASGDRRGLAESLNNLANVHNRRGEFPRAVELLEQSLSIFRELGDGANAGIVLGNIGTIYALMSEDRRALEYFGESLPLLRAAGNRYSEILALNHVGNSHIDLGEPQQALEAYQRAYELSLSLGNKTAQATALAGLGRAYAVFGDTAQAVRVRLQALELGRAAGDGGIESNTLFELGDSYFQLQDYARSVDYSLRAAEKFRAEHAAVGGQRLQEPRPRPHGRGRLRARRRGVREGAPAHPLGRRQVQRGAGAQRLRRGLREDEGVRARAPDVRPGGRATARARRAAQPLGRALRRGAHGARARPPRRVAEERRRGHLD